MNLSVASQIAFNLAVYETQSLRHRFIDSEHLFLGLCKVEDILTVGKEAIADINDSQWQEAVDEIHEFSQALSNRHISAKKVRRRLRKILDEKDIEKGDFSGHRTARCKEAFSIAKRISEGEVKLKHLLIALLGQESPYLKMLFSEFSINKEGLIEEMAKSSSKERDVYKTLVQEKEAEEREEVPLPYREKKAKMPFLDKFGRDITKLAREGRLDPCIGRKEEIKKVAQILHQKRKSNPLLVGDAGVGKTCIVEGLAQKIVEPNTPESIRNLRIVELSIGTIVAGTKYRGEFEERLDNIIKEASLDKNIVLFIDEIHTLMGAGAGGDALDAANILKPALARGEIKCIGATTTPEYRKYIEKDEALKRRFQVIWVEEPTKEEAVAILKGIRPKFEKYHGVRIPDKVIERSVEFSMRYLPDFRLPDKAIDIIDQASARKILKTFSPLKVDEKAITELTIEDIAKVVSERSRVPVEDLTMEESRRLLAMEEHLKQRIMGQDSAIKVVSESIRSAKAGLKDPNKPVGVFLFLGATGIGKTELAKAVAEFLFHDERHFITFDMSEYQERHTVARLIGAPPGYVGYEDEGQLISKVRTNPYSVILFDEIEKAHPDVFDIFLQIFDEGRLTDSHGRRANFTEAVIILTSNIGSNLSAIGRPIGVDIRARVDYGGAVPVEEAQKWKAYEEQILKAISTAFRPEFLNRIQKKVIFYPLSRESVRRILNEKIVKSLNLRLSQKGINVELSESAIEFLLDKGYSELYGAREMQRTFDTYICEPLSEMVLKGEVKEGQLVKVSAEAERLKFEIS